MYAAIRQAKAKSGSAEELARRIKDGAVPIISDVDGFRAYYVVYAGDDTVTAISIFDKFEQAEEANKRAIAWIEKDLGPLLAGHASAAAGPVIVCIRWREVRQSRAPAAVQRPRRCEASSVAVRCRAGALCGVRGSLGPGSAQQRKSAAARPGHEN
jgi:hypothetical protein